MHILMLNHELMGLIDFIRSSKVFYILLLLISKKISGVLFPTTSQWKMIFTKGIVILHKHLTDPLFSA